MVNPAFGAASHCIGVRSGSRPTPRPGSFISQGSCTCSGGISHVAHADLVAIIERRRAAQGEQQHGRDPRLARADPAGDARLVMVAQHPVGPPARRQRGFVFARSRRPIARACHGSRDQLEIEGQVGARRQLAP